MPHRILSFATFVIVASVVAGPASGQGVVPAAFTSDVTAAPMGGDARSARAPASAGTPSPAATPAAPTPTATAAPAAEAEPREWFGSGQRWTAWSRMTGDWGTLRRSLEARGVTFGASATSDTSRPTSGVTAPASASRALLDVGVDIDLERAGLGRGRVFIGYQTKGGGDGWRCLDEAQGFSNIDADDFRRVGEVYYERSFGERLRIKAGINDANAEFAFVENGGEFINSSMGFSPSIAVMPTYPDPQLGVVLQAQPTSWSYVGGGLYDGGPALGTGTFDAVFAIGEAGLRWGKAGGGRVGVGYWHTRGAMLADELTRTTVSTGGQYVVLDQTVWSDGATEQPRRVAVFGQAGFANADVSAVTRHLGGGVVASGFVPGRPADVVGVGITSVRFGHAVECAEAPFLDAEMNVGMFYRFALTGWLSLKPDLQIIRHPAGARESRTVAVGTVRIEVGF